MSWCPTSEFLNHLIHIYEDWRDQCAIGGHLNALFIYLFIFVNHQLQHGCRTRVGTIFSITLGFRNVVC